MCASLVNTFLVYYVNIIYRIIFNKNQIKLNFYGMKKSINWLNFKNTINVKQKGENGIVGWIE